MPERRLSALKAEFEAIRKKNEDRLLDNYVEVEAGSSFVSQHIQKAAEAVASMCARDLRIPAPRIRWFIKETSAHKSYRETWGTRDFGTELGTFFKSEPIRGRTKCYRSEVWIRAGMSLWETLKTVAHECRHLTQSISATGLSLEQQTEQDEADAEAYASSKMPEIRKLLYG